MPNLVEEEISPEEQESEQNFHFPPEHEKNVISFPDADKNQPVLEHESGLPFFGVGPEAGLNDAVKKSTISERALQFIRDFSKGKGMTPEDQQQAMETRKQAAKGIREKRTQYFTEKRGQEERAEELRILQEKTAEREHHLEIKLQQIKNLGDKIEILSSSLLSHLANYFELKKLHADLMIGQKTYDELEQQQGIDTKRINELVQSKEMEQIPPQLEEAKQMLDNFYKQQKEKWANSEYTKEDVVKYFSEENLSKLSLEDYVLFLKRFPSEMVTHVTRQGIRDHVGHMYHQAGMSEYADGFMKLARDGRLRSALGVHLVERAKEQGIADFLHLDKAENQEQALAYLKNMTNPKDQGGISKYVDYSAIHVATEQVVDCYYGSEKGNEIFFAFPSNFIASQYYFVGQLNSDGGDNKHNDQWIWANEEKGLDINAGLVFLPADAKVDRNNGSRYELDKEKRPIINEQYVKALRDVISSADFSNVSKLGEQVTPNSNSSWLEFLNKGQEALNQILEQKYGITDKRVSKAIMENFSEFNTWRSQLERKPADAEVIHRLDQAIKTALADEGALFMEAQNSINSKDFWENYFANHPKQRPSKVVYYEGGDPTAALFKWRKENGLEKRSKDDVMGYAEHRIDDLEGQRATAGMDRFRTLAEKVISDYFTEKHALSAAA